jgi:hypothetical protein
MEVYKAEDWPILHAMASKQPVRGNTIKRALIATSGDVTRNHTLQMAAALAYPNVHVWDAQGWKQAGGGSPV